MSLIFTLFSEIYKKLEEHQDTNLKLGASGCDSLEKEVCQPHSLKLLLDDAGTSVSVSAAAVSLLSVSNCRLLMQ